MKKTMIALIAGVGVFAALTVLVAAANPKSAPYPENGGGVSAHQPDIEVGARAPRPTNASSSVNAVRPPYRVALVVQNHTSDAPTLPLAAFADTLTSRLSGQMLRVINPHNAIGTTQNRTARGETMPEASAQEIGRVLGADGVITASITEFTNEGIGVPAIAYKLKVRIALNLADAATGETVCSVDGVEFSKKNYLPEQVKSDTDTLFASLMHDAAANTAEKLLSKVASVEWKPVAADVVHVNFTCNRQGAVIKMDGLAMGTAPGMVTVAKGVHNITVEYPFCIPFSMQAFCTDGQTYNAVLPLDATGRERFKSEALFAETLDRIRKTGATDDYVRKTLADGTSQYWKNSGVKIDHGEVKDLKLDPPGGSESVAPRSPTVDQLMEKAKGL